MTYMKNLTYVYLILMSLTATLLTTPHPASAQEFLEELYESLPTTQNGRQSIYFSNEYDRGAIVVSFSDRRLYYVKRKGAAYSYPIAVPHDKAMWKGELKVTAKKENPTWRPTREMRAENPKLPQFVPGGHPRNPLGKRALYLGDTLYRIHGTDAPWTIGSAVSKGCIRMHNDDVIDLYKRVPVGARVIVTWRRFSS